MLVRKTTIKRQNRNTKNILKTVKCERLSSPQVTSKVSVHQSAVQFMEEFITVFFLSTCSGAKDKLRHAIVAYIHLLNIEVIAIRFFTAWLKGPAGSSTIFPDTFGSHKKFIQRAQRNSICLS